MLSSREGLGKFRLYRCFGVFSGFFYFFWFFSKLNIFIYVEELLFYEFRLGEDENGRLLFYFFFL